MLNVVESFLNVVDNINVQCVLRHLTSTASHFITLEFTSTLRTVLCQPYPQVKSSCDSSCKYAPFTDACTKAHGSPFCE